MRHRSLAGRRMDLCQLLRDSSRHGRFTTPLTAAQEVDKPGHPAHFPDLAVTHADFHATEPDSLVSRSEVCEAGISGGLWTWAGCVRHLASTSWGSPSIESWPPPPARIQGFTRDGHCRDVGDDDAGSHHICIQMKSDFCKVTGVGRVPGIVMNRGLFLLNTNKHMIAIETTTTATTVVWAAGHDDVWGAMRGVGRSASPRHARGSDYRPIPRLQTPFREVLGAKHTLCLLTSNSPVATMKH